MTFCIVIQQADVKCEGQQWLSGVPVDLKIGRLAVRDPVAAQQNSCHLSQLLPT